MTLVFIISILLIFHTHQVKSGDFFRKKPNYVHSCQLSQPNLGKCFVKSLRLIFKQLFIGIPEVFEERGPLDPYHYDDFIFKEKNQLMDLEGHYSSVTISGFSNLSIIDYRLDNTSLNGWSKFYTPMSNLRANYKLNGRVLLLPFNCTGNFECLSEDMMVSMKTYKKLYKKQGFIFANITHVETKLIVKNMKTKYNNFFGGVEYPEVDKALNELINDNWQAYFEAVEPIVVKFCNTAYLDLLNTIFKLIPFNFIIEDLPDTGNVYQNND